MQNNFYLFFSCSSKKSIKLTEYCQMKKSVKFMINMAPLVCIWRINLVMTWSIQWCFIHQSGSSAFSCHAFVCLVAALAVFVCVVASVAVVANADLKYPKMAKTFPTFQNFRWFCGIFFIGIRNSIAGCGCWRALLYVALFCYFSGRRWWRCGWTGKWISFWYINM